MTKTKISAALLLSTASFASAYDVVGISGPNSSRPFSGPDYSNARAALSNPANFGPGGVVRETINFLPDLTTVTPAALTGAELLVLAEVNSLTTAEQTAVGNFVRGGGNLLVIEDSSRLSPGASAVLTGLGVGNFSGNAFGGGGPNVINTATPTPALTGPFAAIGQLSGTPCTGFVTGPNAVVTSRYAAGDVVATVELLRGVAGPGAGAALVTTDVLFQNFFVPPGSLYNDADNGLYLQNWVASTVPEPTAAVLAAAPAALLLRRRRRTGGVSRSVPALEGVTP